MGEPSPQRQLEFLTNLQRLFAEGSFVATYKFALLSALADLCVERGADTDAELKITTREIAEKFARYYWRQSQPFAARQGQSTSVILRQNTGREAGVIRLLRRQIADGFVSLNSLQRDRRRWTAVVTAISAIVRQMPLWKLQTVGTSSLEFLYPNVQRGHTIILRPGVMFCFRAFHPFISDMVRGAWVRYVRRYNQDQLGDPSDLDQFLFGAERAPLAVYAPILRELQESRCFYCGREIQAQSAHVDHFVPWAIYSVDLGHNFVLADGGCNSAKAEHLAAVEHLGNWSRRNEEAGSYLRERFDQMGVIHDIAASTMIADWAYQRASASGAATFRSRDAIEPLPANWRQFLRTAT